jgi:type IV pilus assembly protein PilP
MFKYLLIISSCSLLLTGCGGSNEMKSAENFVASVQKTPAPPVEPLPNFTTPQLNAVPPSFQRNPFSPPTEINSASRPDANRPKEPLENFPLDGLHYVGEISEKDKIWALISAPDGMIYKISVGSHMGQNYGKVASILPTKIILLETIPDGLGGWTQRSTELLLTTTTQESGP